MPLIWSNIVGGEAPWEDATSYTGSVYETRDSPGTNGITLGHTLSAGDTQYTRGGGGSGNRTYQSLDLVSEVDIQTASGETSNYVAFNETTQNNSTYNLNLAGSYAYNVFNTLTASGRAVSQVNNANTAETSTAGETTVYSYSSVSSSVESLSSDDGVNATFIRAWTLVSGGTTVGAGGNGGTTIILTGGSSTHTASATFSSTAGITDISSGTFIAASPFGSAVATTGWAPGTDTFIDDVETTAAFTGERSIIVSTALTSGSGTNTGTIPSTTDDTQSYTYVGRSNASSVGFFMEAQTASYNRGTAHLETVVQATQGEILRIHTATADSPISAEAVLGAPATRITLNSYVGSEVLGLGFDEADNSITHTAISVFMSASTIVGTASVETSYSFTQRANDGWIGGTATVAITEYGLSTSTTPINIGVLTTATDTVVGGYPRTSWIFMQSDTCSTVNVVGVNASGGSVGYAIQVPYAVPFWTSYLLYEGHAGNTITRYQSPNGSPIIGMGQSVFHSSVVRDHGFQFPQSMGSSVPQAMSIAATSAFFIGEGNFGVGAPNRISVPVESYSTAQTGASSYSISLRTDGFWFVTAASSGLDGTSTTYSVVTFSESLSAAGVGDHYAIGANQRWTYGLSSIYQYSDKSAITAAGGQVDNQAVTFAGWGFRYTVGDSTGGTSSTKGVLSRPFTTAPLNGSILAAESFYAGFGDRSLKSGAVSYVVLPYNYARL